MKKFFLLLFSICSLHSYSQLAVNIQTPQNGLLDKQQLWNMLISNTGTPIADLRIQIVLSDAINGEAVLSATTGLLMINTGTRQLSAASMGPIHYNVLNSSYRMDPGPGGILPPGDFNICYNFIANSGKQILQDCQQLHIEPLSPLLLNMPDNGSTLEDRYPNFSWLPIPSVQLSAQLTYTFQLVQILDGQSAADAMEKNVPVYTARHLNSAGLVYAQHAPAMEKGKHYAWQVTAFNNNVALTKSEVWKFSTDTNTDKVSLPKPNAAYAKFKKEGTAAGINVFVGSLQLEYLNETSDTTWNVQLTDISSSRPKTIRCEALENWKIVRGENLIYIPAAQLSSLKSKHIYLLQITNSRREKWQLKFEFRKERK